MSTDKPFPVEPGYEYLQGQHAVGIKSHELEWWHDEFKVWQEIHGPIVIPVFSKSWFRRKLPAPQPKSEWVRFADRWPPSLYYPLWVWSAEVSYHGNQPIICVDAAHAKIAFATHWMKAELPAPPPPEPTQEEKDREAAEGSWVAYKIRVEEDPSPDCPTRRETYETAFLAGIQLGRKSK